MNKKQMIKRLKAGEKPIDLAIEKWEGILEGKGYDKRSKNCSLCYIFNYCKDCPTDTYELSAKEKIKNGDCGACGGFYSMFMTYEDKQCMLQMLYTAKKMMTEDKVY